MDNILRPWRHYVDFSGRSTRTEFWLFFIVFYVVLAVLFLVPILAFDIQPADMDRRESGLVLLMLPGCLFMFAGILPGIAVVVRRLHDSDKSGWMYLLTCIPYIGFIFFIAFGCMRGTHGENSYGFDPRLGEGAPDFDAPEVFS